MAAVTEVQLLKLSINVAVRFHCGTKDTLNTSQLHKHNAVTDLTGVRYMSINCCRLLMDSVPSQLSAFEGYPGRLVFRHNFHLLKTAQYKAAGQFITWSVANGGPGIAGTVKTRH